MTLMRKICPKCSETTMEEEVQFCYMDGEKLVASEVCSCGRGLHPIDNYCPKCGKEVAKKEAVHAS